MIFIIIKTDPSKKKKTWMIDDSLRSPMTNKKSP